VRIGVSGKIFLAYAVLLLAFAGSTSFTIVTIHRAREGVVANEAYLDLQGSVDSAWKALNDFAGALGRNLGKEPNLALAIRAARKNLDDALVVIDRYLAREPSSAHRGGFETVRRQIETFKGELDHLATELGSVRVDSEDGSRAMFESRFANLTRGLNRLRRPLRGESAQIAQRLADDGDNARQVALLVGGLGLLVAAFAVAFMWRTLRPLRVLRVRARQIAGGEYGRRTGVRSRDEIGDLARELDAMADAVEEREQRLIRSERLATVGKMAAQVTHEVRNPLASIGLYAELLGDEISDAPEARRLITSISSEVDRLTEITETYLRFARLPQPKLDREDLAALVASVAEFARAELAQSGIALDLDLPPTPVEVAADENQLRQALLNLVRNAREAMTSGGRLRIGVQLRRQDGTAVISVTDSGAGIAAEHLPKIFDPFFSTKTKGTGLGLALVQQIAVEHGGRAEVERNAADAPGTTFRLVLPVAPEGVPSEGEGKGKEMEGGEARRRERQGAGDGDDVLGDDATAVVAGAAENVNAASSPAPSPASGPGLVLRSGGRIAPEGT
jgi:two-component system NtrC family sensor kinase